MAKFNESELDPGIRKLVVLLRNFGFKTTDSGDGVSKPAKHRALDVPHVFIRAERKTKLLSEAHHLGEVVALITGMCDLAPGTVQASYDPADRSAVLSVIGISDSDLDEKYREWCGERTKVRTK